MTSPGAGVPRVPLPALAHARLALLGDGDARVQALDDALSTTGRSYHRYLLREVGPQGGRLDADVVVVSCKLSELLALAPRLTGVLDGAVLVCSMAATSGDPAEPRQDEGSSAVQRLATALPLSRVVGALQQFTTEHFELMSLRLLKTDVPVTGDDLEAADLVQALLREMSGVDAVYAGPLRNAGAVEHLGEVLRDVEARAGRPLGFRLDPARGVRFLDR